MNRYYLIKLLLTPSTLSAALCLIAAAATAGATAWSFIGERQLFYEYLFGIYGFSTLLVQDTGTLYAFKRAVFESNATYYILILLCSLLVGILVYTLLEGIRLASQQTSIAWRQLHTPGSVYAQAAHRNLMRLIVRAVALAGWAAYTVIFVNILLPTSLIFTRAGVESIDLGEQWGWMQVVQGFVLLAACLHLHVVFARLTTLRPRLFGGDDIKIAGYHEPVPGSEGLRNEGNNTTDRFLGAHPPSLFPNRDQSAAMKTQSAQQTGQKDKNS